MQDLHALEFPYFLNWFYYFNIEQNNLALLTRQEHMEVVVVNSLKHLIAHFMSSLKWNCVSFKW